MAIAEAEVKTETPEVKTETKDASPEIKPEIKTETKDANKSLLGAAQAEPKKEEAKAVVPEKYADFTLPEGVSLDKGLLEKALPVFKKYALSQEAAQEFVSLQCEHAKAGVEAVMRDAEIQKAKVLEDFKQQTIKELGSDYQKELGFAAKALDRFGGLELRKLLDDTGFGMHPLMVKAFIAIGKAMSEDGMPGKTVPAPEDSEEAQKRVMFPSMYDSEGNLKK